MLDEIIVQNALDAMAHAQPLGQQHPLAALLSLQERSRSGLWSGGLGSDVRVFRGLTRLIYGRLCRQRRVLGLADPSLRQMKETALSALRQDFACDNPELEARSLLYYRYVRVDLGLSVDQMRSVVNSTRRTLQRRQ